MGQISKKAFRVLCLCLLVTVLSGIIQPVASSENWSEVFRFTGSKPLTGIYAESDDFICEHAEWRIRWEYVPDSTMGDVATFAVYTYRRDETGATDLINVTARVLEPEDTSGISYIHEETGVFYMEILYNSVESYTVIVEQDLNSIPEFPSWIILPLVLAITLFSIIFKRKLTSSLIH
jgi:hypothetical protein